MTGVPGSATTGEPGLAAVLTPAGQLSGLAAPDLRFVLLGPLVARSPRVFPVACSLAYAPVAGLAGGGR